MLGLTTIAIIYLFVCSAKQLTNSLKIVLYAVFLHQIVSKVTDKKTTISLICRIENEIFKTNHLLVYTTYPPSIYLSGILVINIRPISSKLVKICSFDEKISLLIFMDTDYDCEGPKLSSVLLCILKTDF